MTASSWVAVPESSPFPLQNLPYGVFTAPGRSRRIGVAIGRHVLDLRATAEAGLLGAAGESVAHADSLNPLLAAGRPVWRELRSAITAVLRTTTEPAADLLVEQDAARMHLPARIGDYVDFYSGLEHATTMGRLFRPDGDPLLPQWRHLPMAYHGRAATVAVSGTPVRRPHGLRPGPDGGRPQYGLTEQLDHEVELGCLLGTGNRLGEPIRAADAEEHVFGFVLLNDWSARDVQRYEYVPFGPFAGKSFLTSVSPWVVTAEALAPWRVHRPEPVPTADYLCSDVPWNIAVTLETQLQTTARERAGEPAVRIARTRADRLYWDCAQWLAHLTVNGAVVAPGDLLGSGTISGWSDDEKGCLAERTAGGRNPVAIGDEKRIFLEDGDTVRISGICRREDAVTDPGYQLGFEDVVGTVIGAS